MLSSSGHLKTFGRLAWPLDEKFVFETSALNIFRCTIRLLNHMLWISQFCFIGIEMHFTYEELVVLTYRFKHLIDSPHYSCYECVRIDWKFCTEIGHMTQCYDHLIDLADNWLAIAVMAISWSFVSSFKILPTYFYKKLPIYVT